jgi:hypothetical protein
MKQLLISSCVLSFFVIILQVDGALKKVSSGSELQSALDSAKPGDTIILSNLVL